MSGLSLAAAESFFSLGHRVLRQLLAVAAGCSTFHMLTSATVASSFQFNILRSQPSDLDVRLDLEAVPVFCSHENATSTAVEDMAQAGRGRGKSTKTARINSTRVAAPPHHINFQRIARFTEHHSIISQSAQRNHKQSLHLGC